MDFEIITHGYEGVLGEGLNFGCEGLTGIEALSNIGCHNTSCTINNNCGGGGGRVHREGGVYRGCNMDFCS